MLPISLLILAYASFVFNFEIFNLPISGAVVRIIFLAAALAFVIKRRAYPLVLVCMIVVLALITILGMLASDRNFSWQPIIFAFAQILVIYLFMSCRFTDEDSRAILLIGAFTPLAAVLIGMLYNLAGLYPIIQMGTQGIPRLEGSLIPAFLSAFALSGAYAALKLALPSRSWVFFALTLVNLTILIATGSRMPMALAVPLCLFLVLFSPHLTNRAKIAIPFSGLILVSIPAVLLGSTMMERFERGGTSGRDVMWDYFKGIAETHWWTGIGYMQGYYMELPHQLAITVNTTAVHNDFLRLSAELGFPGMIAFYVLLSVAYVHGAIRNGGWRGFPVALAAYLAFLVYSWSDNSFGTVSNNMLLVLGVVATPARREVEEEADQPIFRFSRAGRDAAIGRA